MIKQTALAMVLASAMAHKATHPFKIGDEVIDFEEIPSLPDPVSYEVEMKKDQQTIAEMKGELESAAKNVDKGSLNTRDDEMGGRSPPNDSTYRWQPLTKQSAELPIPTIVQKSQDLREDVS